MRFFKLQEPRGFQLQSKVSKVGWLAMSQVDEFWREMFWREISKRRQKWTFHTFAESA